MASRVHASTSLSGNKHRGLWATVQHSPRAQPTEGGTKKPNSCIYTYGSINYSLSSNHLCSHQTWWNIGNMTYLRLPCCMHYIIFTNFLLVILAAPVYLLVFMPFTVRTTFAPHNIFVLAMLLLKVQFVGLQYPKHWWNLPECIQGVTAQSLILPRSLEG